KFNFAAGTFCDCQAFLNVYKTWLYHENNQQFRTVDAERRWAQIHNVDIKRLREVHLLVDELRNRLRQLHIFVPRDIRNVPLNEGILYRSQIEQQLKSLVDIEDMKITFENTKALVEFAPQHSTRQIVNPSELPIDQIVTLATSHTNILPAVYFTVEARMTKS
ncbi:unnamed protein product, partial [Rotaria sp. Silwood2]